ncbi:MAG: UPF0149 family protein [Pseudomonadota bacterium]
MTSYNFQLPSKAKLEQSLQDGQVTYSVAYIHGALIGMMAGGMPLDQKSWKAPLMGLVNDDKLLSKDGMAALDSLVQVSCSWFEERISIQMLLPDFEKDLSTRLAALADWCDGWLSGFSLFVTSFEALSAETQETIRELQEIARVATEKPTREDERQAMETMYQDIVEHVTLGVEYIFDECGAGLNNASRH